MAAGNEDESRVALAFHERYWADRAGGNAAALSRYLALWPGHATIVAREYLAIEGAPSLEGGAEPRPSGATGPDRVGSYRLIREIGRGGQGTVHLAEDTRLGRPVALKLLPRAAMTGYGTLARFRREALVASRLQHPGICAVYDAGNADGVAYIAMRYVEGRSLDRMLQRSTAPDSARSELSTIPSPQSADTQTLAEPDEPASAPTGAITSSAPAKAEMLRRVRIVAKAARALHVAHEAGIVHRDIKPGNVMVTPEDEPVILDFGLAREEESEHSALTLSNDVMGTPAYMAPEQIRPQGRHADRRTDVHALGVTLFQCLTGRRPFEAATREGLYREILDRDAPDPHAWNPAVPRDLAVVVSVALAKEPDRRYQTAELFARDLEACLEHRPIAARPISAVGRATRWARRHPARAALVIVLAAGLPIMAALAGRLSAQASQLREKEARDRRDRHDVFVEQGFNALTLYRRDPPARLAEAASCFERAADELPASVEAFIGSVLVARRQGGDEAALRRLDAAPSGVAESAGARRIRSDLLRALGRGEEAAQVLASAPAPDSPLDCALVAAIALERDSAPENADAPDDVEALREMREAAERAVLTAPAARRFFHENWARAIARCGEVPEARRCALALSALWPGDAYARFYSGYALQMAGSAGEAIPHYEAALALDPSMADTHFNLAHARQMLGRTEEAAAGYRKALELRPDDLGALHNLGTVLLSLGRREEALECAEKVLARTPDSADSLFLKTDVLLMLGRPAEVRAMLEPRAERRERDPRTYRALAIACRMLGDAEASEQWLRRGLELRPDDAVTLSELGRTLEDLERLDEALDVARRAAALEPDNDVVVLKLARALHNRGEVEEGRQLVEKVLARDPNDAGAHNHMGLFLLESGDPAGALEHFQVAIRSAAHLLPLHENIVGACTRLRDPRTLAAEMRRWDALGRFDPDGWHALALMLLGAPQSDATPPAVEAAKRAVELSGRKDPRMLLTLARALLAADRDAEALRVAAEARPLVTATPPDADGDALRRELATLESELR